VKDGEECHYNDLKAEFLLADVPEGLRRDQGKTFVKVTRVEVDDENDLLPRQDGNKNLYNLQTHRRNTISVLYPKEKSPVKQKKKK